MAELKRSNMTMSQELKTLVAQVQEGMDSLASNIEENDEQAQEDLDAAVRRIVHKLREDQISLKRFMMNLSSS